MTLSSLSQDISTNLAEKQKIDKVVAFDPTVILVIIQIICAILEQFLRCRKTPKQMGENCKSPGWMEKFLLRRLICRSIDKPTLRYAVYNAILDKGADLTEGDIKDLIDESDMNVVY